MSRDVDPNAKKLSDDDKMYLAQRGQLSTDVMSEADQRKMLRHDAPTLDELANTGTVNTAGISTEDLEAELQKRRDEAEAVDTKKLFTNPGGVAGAAADEDEPLEPPYDQYNKGQLSAEIERRNDEREDEEDYDDMPLSGTKGELVDRLDEDDAQRKVDDDDDE